MVDRYVKKHQKNIFTDDQSLGGHRLEDLADPLLPSDAATKSYVDLHAGRTFPTDLIEAGNATGASEQTLASIVVAAKDLQSGLYLSAWGSFAANNSVKTINLKLGSTIIATNDITSKPNGLSWELEAKIFQLTSSYTIIGGGVVGAVTQSKMFLKPSIINLPSIVISVTAIASSGIANSIICSALISTGI